jgi:DNA polymerase I-like protein with 3'-5' exonuclease and polymerase domains
MANPDFTLEFIKEQNRLEKLSETLLETTAFALDIETVDWWNRHQERVALIQIAFRDQGKIKVAIIDALARLDLQSLRSPLEHTSILKIIHNAAFDAVRLARHYNFAASPIHDTMIAARRAGERKYSLQAQAAIHLQIRLDKQARQSDWSRRPLDYRQLSYAALDAYATLLLYENQTARNLAGEYRLRPIIDQYRQDSLPLDDLLSVNQSESLLSQQEKPAAASSVLENELDAIAAVLLGIVTELPTRYSPDQLSVSLGSDRVGIAGWIADSRLGKDTELDEETVKMTTAYLCEHALLRMTETRRLVATEAGLKMWQKIKLD